MVVEPRKGVFRGATRLLSATEQVGIRTLTLGLQPIQQAMVAAHRVHIATALRMPIAAPMEASPTKRVLAEEIRLTVHKAELQTATVVPMQIPSVTGAALTSHHYSALE